MNNCKLILYRDVILTTIEFSKDNCYALVQIFKAVLPNIKPLGYSFLLIVIIFCSSFPFSYASIQQESRRTDAVVRLSATKNLRFSIRKNPFKYDGSYYDTESGCYYLKARYYSPEIKSFINRDTYNLPNRYAYCNGDPINETDPRGHTSIMEIAKWGKVICGTALITASGSYAIYMGLTSPASLFTRISLVSSGVFTLLTVSATILSACTKGKTSETFTKIAKVSFMAIIPCGIAAGVSAALTTEETVTTALAGEDENILAPALRASQPVEGEICPICRDPLDNDVVQLPCNHFLHRAPCLRQNITADLQREGLDGTTWRCPICRQRYRGESELVAAGQAEHPRFLDALGRRHLAELIPA